MIVTRSHDAGSLPVQQHAAQCDSVKEIALKCLKEFAFSCACNLLVSSFVFTAPGTSLLISLALVQSAVNLFFHCAGSFTKAHESVNEAFGWIKSANFAIFTGYNMQNLLHEIGHSLAAFALYKNPKPTIELYPFIGGLTQFYKTKLSSLGNLIGPAATTCLVVASGPGFTLLISSALLVIGLSLRKTHPNLSKYLISWSILDFVHHAHYAYSAMSAETWNLSHDFVHLSIFGAHPLAVSIGIIAIPTVILLGSYCIRTQTSQ